MWWTKKQDDNLSMVICFARFLHTTDFICKPQLLVQGWLTLVGVYGNRLAKEAKFGQFID